MKHTGTIEIDCKNSGQPITDHFADVRKTINMPKGAVKDAPTKDLLTYCGLDSLYQYRLAKIQIPLIFGS